ncbi:MAG: hypothetical protein CL931_00960 [Deltaproteobacteria bacterium]|nr:hypothetical protein [Deltaproteobacteria bacterium]
MDWAREKRRANLAQSGPVVNQRSVYAGLAALAGDRAEVSEPVGLLRLGESAEVYETASLRLAGRRSEGSVLV